MSFLPPHLITLRENLLEQKSPEAALAIFEEYFHIFPPDEAREELWHLLAGALTSEETNIKTALDRSNLLFYFEYTRLLLDAAHVLSKAALSETSKSADGLPEPLQR